jgi:hypothetical protein
MPNLITWHEQEILKQLLEKFRHIERMFTGIINYTWSRDIVKLWNIILARIQHQSYKFHMYMQQGCLKIVMLWKSEKNCDIFLLLLLLLLSSSWRRTPTWSSPCSKGQPAGQVTLDDPSQWQKHANSRGRSESPAVRGRAGG